MTSAYSIRVIHRQDYFKPATCEIVSGMTVETL